MTPLTKSATTRAQAYLLLGVEPNAVAAAPKIAHLIARISGGKSTALAALRASDLPEARHFISKYDNLLLPAFVRKVLPMEAFAVAAGLSPTRLFGVIAEVIRTQKAQLGAIKAAERHEEIVTKSSQLALDPDREADRMAHLKHMGFTPSPKGSTINIGVVANASATAAAKSDSAALASPEDTIRRMVEARQQSALARSPQRELPAPSADPVAFMPRAIADPVTIDADYGDSDDVSSD